jgi:hypothetical protein
MNTSDIKLYKSQVISDADTNGGYLSYNEIVNNVLNNVFPNVTYSERIAGINRYRKVFLKNNNSSNETLFNAHIGLLTPSPADDIFYIFAGTSSDVQSNVKDVGGGPVSGTKLLGGGALKTDVSAGATDITVTFEANDFVIEAGDKILISSKIDPLSGTGSEEYGTVSSVSAWTGNDITITLSSGLSNSYTASSTYVSIMLPLGDIVADATVTGTTTISGTYDNVTYPIVAHNQGCVDDVWTFVFTSSTAYSVTSVNYSYSGSGNVSSQFEPTNPSTLTPYFTIPVGFFGGTWQTGETLTLTTTSASSGFWIYEKVPAGANSYSNNSVALRIYGE